MGEILVLAGTFLNSRAHAAFAATGMILGAVYMLWMYQRVFLGKITNSANAAMKDLGTREKLILIPVMVADALDRSLLRTALAANGCQYPVGAAAD